MGHLRHGVMSLVPLQRFRACRDVVSVRNSATMEWGDTIGHLLRDARVAGYMFGNWLWLAVHECRDEIHIDSADGLTTDAWVCVVSEHEEAHVMVREYDTGPAPLPAW